jgi:hypothetical protein
MRRGSDRSLLLSENYTHCGVAYVYAPRNPYSYLWGAVFAAPGPPLPTFVPPEPDPAQAAADEADSVLDRVPLPTVAGFEPDKLAEVAAEFGKAAQRVRVAEETVTRLMAESYERTARLAELTALRTTGTTTAYDVWATYADDALAIGATVYTAEIPGFWQRTPTPRTVTLYAGTSRQQTITVQELNWNIVQRVVPSAAAVGVVTPAISMTPSQSFFYAATEPGSFKWHPTWRYGTLSAIGESGFSVTLESQPSRLLRGESALSLDFTTETLTAVETSYSCPSVFAVGDEVLVQFVGFNQAQPLIVGFRRSPKICPIQRISWGQIS